MPSKLRVFLADTFDPWFNLATEEWMLRELEPCPTLYLWRNADTVVIGRCQNPWSECNLAKMQADNVKLARRQSGGGAVFQDLGNTNFTFVSAREEYQKQVNNDIITHALKSFAIDAYASGRNDILVDGKKISGSAFKELKDRCLHHGTLLINANLTKLGSYLSPSKKKLQSKGLASVKMRVANLCQFNHHIDHDSLSRAIIEQFFEYYGSECPVQKLDYQVLKTIPKLNEYYDNFRDWNWRFGESPQFSHQLDEHFSWGSVELHLNCTKGVIRELKIYSDSLYPEMVEIVTQVLTGIRYEAKIVAAAIASAKLQLPALEQQLAEFNDWLTREISR